MSWIAGIRGIKVQRGGKTVALPPGEPCPEAEDFKNRGLYLDNKQLDWVQDEGGRPVPPIEKTLSEKALEAATEPEASDDGASGTVETSDEIAPEPEAEKPKKSKKKSNGKK